MNILEKFLKKCDVKNFYELNAEEKETYRKWGEILNGRKLTDEEVKMFFDSELEDTISKLVTKKRGEREDTFLKVKLEFLRKVKGFLNVPEMEKKLMENSINQQLEQ